MKCLHSVSLSNPGRLLLGTLGRQCFRVLYPFKVFGVMINGKPCLIQSFSISLNVTYNFVRDIFHIRLIPRNGFAIKV